MTFQKISSLSFLAIALVGGASAQITKSNAGYTLRARYAKGQVIRFLTVSGIDSTTSSLANMKLTVPITLRVIDIKKGVATVKLTMGAVIVEGHVVQPEQSTTFPLDNRNQGYSGTTNIGAKLPVKPVKIGSQWKSVMPINIGGTTAALEGVYRFAGLKTVNGRSVGVITYSLSGPAEGTGTLLMLASDGTMYSNDTKLSMTGGNRQLTRIHSTMSRS